MKNFKQDYSVLDSRDVTRRLAVDERVGLSEKEALRRLKKTGYNKLVDTDTVSLFALFVNQFKDFMVFVLLLATLISGVLGEYTDAVVILAIVLFNGFFGFLQEVKAEKSLEALKELASPVAYVLRQGKLQKIKAKELVVGDIVYVSSGDRVPADVRFLKTENLYIEEAMFTGEAAPAKKETYTISKASSFLDRVNMGFMGTMVVSGKGVGVVVATGMATEMGKITHLLQNTKAKDTPLQKRLEQLGKVLIYTALLLTSAVVLVGVLNGNDFYKMFLAGVSLAVASIPEGLPAIVTVSLALGVQRMIKKNAIVRKLSSVETLGCADVICSDKTGTLTQNKMVVTNLWADGKNIKVLGKSYSCKGDFFLAEEKIDLLNFTSFRLLITIAYYCNNANFKREDIVENKELLGNPTEISLLVLAYKTRFEERFKVEELEKLKEIPFDSRRKMMSVITRDKNGKMYIYTKGAVDSLLTKCKYIFYNDKVFPLTPSLKEEVLKVNSSFGSLALRNIAFAYQEIAKSSCDLKDENLTSLEKNLIFVGLAGIDDPVREEVAEAILNCKSAGIRTVMITGDHIETALAVAQKLGIKREKSLAISGEQLDKMQDEEFLQKVEQIDIYARVEPRHKLRIVKTLQAKGHIVAMTGDGINDAPAIKAADIGIAMGIAGTDVSKQASSLILLDDNFATIVAAIEEGRNIYNNIRKFIAYLLASNVGEILVMFLAMLFSLPLPLTPLQILWVNLVTDGFPAMALGVDTDEEDVMKCLPRNPNTSIFADGLGWKILTRGLLIGLFSLISFVISYEETPYDLTRSQTITFATLVFSQLIYVFDCRCKGDIFQRNPFGNIFLVLAVFFSSFLLLVVIYYPPFSNLFHTTYLSFRDFILIFICSSLPVILASFLDKAKLFFFKVLKKFKAFFKKECY